MAEAFPWMTSNILKLNIFSALKMMLFPMAIITLYWKDHIGLSLTQILLVNVFFSTAQLVMEYPSGYVSDRLGYRKSLLIACVFGILGWCVYLQARSFWHVVGAESLLGICYAFISGSDTALLYESLRAGGRSELYTRCDGRMAGWAQIGEAGGALCAGLLYAASPLMPFCVQIGVWLLALLVVISLKEPEVELAAPLGSHLQEAIRISRHGLLDNGLLRSTMILGMLLGLSSYFPVWLVQPFMQDCGVPLAWFGPVWAGANLMVAFCAYHSHKVYGLLGIKRLLLCFFILIVGGYLGLGLTSMVGSFLFYYLLTAMRGLQGPVLRSFLQHNTSRAMRASILSLYSLLFRVGYVVTGPLVGILSDGRGINTTFLVLAGAFALLLPLAMARFLSWQQRGAVTCES